jgi:hypothetical protein
MVILPAAAVQSSAFLISSGPLNLQRVLLPSAHQHVVAVYLPFYCQSNPLTPQLPPILPHRRSLLGLHDSVYPQSRHHVPNPFELINHRPQQALALATDCQGLLQYHRTTPEPALRYSACIELDREYLVLSAGRTSW